MTVTTGRWDIGDVLARVDLAALLDELALPAATGRRWHCPIPGHDDHHASVTMFTDHRGHQRWRCWSGDDTHRGDAIDLVAGTRRLGRGDAIDWLAQRSGLTAGQPPPPAPARTTRTGPQRSEAVPLSPVVADYVHACAHLLWTPVGEPVRHWLHTRGLGDDILRVNHVGADPGRGRLERRHGLPIGHSIAATFPAHDSAGDITYVQTRYLDPGDRPKYDNPAGVFGSNPRLAWTRTQYIPKAPVLVVCEGIPDALTAAQTGFAAVALLGSHAADQPAAARLADHATRHRLRIVAVIDADPAGRAAGRRLAAHLASHGQRLHVVEPRIGGDLNAWARHDRDWPRTIAHPFPRTRQPASRGLDL